MIVHSLETVTLIGGASVNNTTLSRARAVAPRIVAADGGADVAHENGLIPEAVIGDFDSISDATRARLPDSILHYIDDQDTTDFDKCLSQISAPLIIGVGFTAGRQDHQLACYNTLVRFAGQPCVLLGQHELVFLAPPTMLLDLHPRTVVSLFPLGAVEGTSDGLEWEISGLNFAPDGRVGTSNRAKGPVHLSVTSPKMLVILPSDALDIVVQALSKSAARWD